MHYGFSYNLSKMITYFDIHAVERAWYFNGNGFHRFRMKRKTTQVDWPIKSGFKTGQFSAWFHLKNSRLATAIVDFPSQIRRKIFSVLITRFNRSTHLFQNRFFTFFDGFTTINGFFTNILLSNNTYVTLWKIQ